MKTGLKNCLLTGRNGSRGGAEDEEERNIENRILNKE